MRAGVTTVVDQGGACIAPDAGAARRRALRLQLPADDPHHRRPPREEAIEGNRDLVKGIKAHGEVGGYSRWGVETLRLAKAASRAAKVPVYVHLGRLWAEADGTRIDPDTVVPEVVPLLDPGDISRTRSPRTRGPSSRGVGWYTP